MTIFRNIGLNLILISILFNNACLSVNILTWHGGSWWGLGERPYKHPNYLGQTVDNEKECSYQCHNLNDHKKLYDAQLVILEGQPLSTIYYQYLEKPPLFPQKEVGQRFVNFGFEHDVYFPIIKEQRYLDHIDYNMTFQNTSDVHITFSCLWGVYDTGKGLDTFTSYDQVLPFNKKKKSMAMIAYNCDQGGANFRNLYVRDLMSKFKLESFGMCFHTTDFDPEDVMPLGVWKDMGMSMKYKTQTIRKHLFVIAFENNNFTDYVSEKVYTAFLAGTVPIYMGADNIDQYVPEKSIIKTSDFPNAYKLGEYLQYLEQNETAYNEYFDWKKKPLPSHFIDKYNKCIFYSGECRLCKLITDQVVKDNHESIKNDRFRLDFGETYEDIKGVKALSLHNDSCLSLVNSIDYKNLLDKNFTFEAWIFPDKIRPVRLFKMGDSILEINTVIFKKRMYLEVCMNNGDDCVITDRHYEIGWRHFAFTLEHNHTANTVEIKLYVNAMLDATRVWSGSMKTSTTFGILVGCHEAQFTGLVDDLTIWNKPLTEREISKSMFKKFRGDEAGLVLYMTFNGQYSHDYSINHHIVTEKNTRLLDVEYKTLDLRCC